MTRKWFEVNHLWNDQCSANKNIMFKTPTLRLDLCDYSDVYIVAKCTVTVAGTNVDNLKNKKTKF